MKRLLILIAIVLASQTILKSQYKYEETLLITNEDYLYSETLDSINSEFVASGYCNYSPKLYGKSILMVKWDNWSMGYNSVCYYNGPGVRDEEGRHIIKTSDGGFLIVGNTNSYKATTDFDGFALKTNSAGTVQWFNVFGGAYTDMALSSCEDSNNVYVVGNFCENSSSTYKGIVYCFNKTTGATVWAKSYKCTTAGFYQTFNSVIIGNDGNLVIGGYVMTSVHNAICVKLNKTNGNVIWSNRYSASLTKILASNVIKGANNSYLLTGIRNFTTGYGDVMLININESGNVKWAKYYNGGNIDYGIQTTFKNNRYITTGTTKSFGSDDLFLMKTDTSGTLDWVNLYHDATTREGLLTAVGSTPLIDMGNNGFALVSGQNDANSILNSYLLSMNSLGETGCETDSVFTTTTLSLTRTTLPDSLNNITAIDTTITKVNTYPAIDTICDSTSMFANKKFKLQNENSKYETLFIYPNPSKGIVNIITNMDGESSELTVYDFMGKVLFKQSISNSINKTTSLDFSSFNKGIYFIQVTNSGNKITKKVVIE